MMRLSLGDAVSGCERTKVDAGDIETGHTFDLQHLPEPTERTVGAVLQDDDYNLTTSASS
jgi:hypothetical protein